MLNLDPENNVQISFKVTRLRGSMDSLSSLRVSQRVLVQHGGGSEMGFYRLSMPIQCAATLRSPAEGGLQVPSSSLTPSSGLEALLAERTPTDNIVSSATHENQ